MTRRSSLRRHPGRRSRAPGGLRLLREQADQYRRGRRHHAGDARAKEQIDSERNQGRAPDIAWLDHDQLGLNYRLSDIACALGIVSMQKLDELLQGRSRVAELHRQACGGLILPAPERDGNVRSWFVFVVQLPAEVDREEAIGLLQGRGIQSKPYLPAIHTMSFYRERYGYGSGEHPVWEAVAKRSLRLPFFSGMKDEQVLRVVAALTNTVAAARSG